MGQLGINRDAPQFEALEPRVLLSSAVGLMGGMSVPASSNSIPGQSQLVEQIDASSISTQQVVQSGYSPDASAQLFDIFDTTAPSGASGSSGSGGGGSATASAAKAQIGRAACRGRGE